MPLPIIPGLTTDCQCPDSSSSWAKKVVIKLGKIEKLKTLIPLWITGNKSPQQNQ